MLTLCNLSPSTKALDLAAIRSDFPSLSEEYAGVEAAAKDTLQCLLEFQRAFSGTDEEGGASDPAGTNGEAGWRALSDTHESYMAFVREEVDRWHRKTMLASSAGAKRGHLRSLSQSVSSQVSALMADPTLVTKRTHIAKNSKDHRVLCSTPRKRGASTSGADDLSDEDNPETNLLEVSGGHKKLSFSAV